jgi:hypothetical protein
MQAVMRYIVPEVMIAVSVSGNWLQSVSRSRWTSDLALNPVRLYGCKDQRV